MGREHLVSGSTRRGGVGALARPGQGAREAGSCPQKRDWGSWMNATGAGSWVSTVAGLETISEPVARASRPCKPLAVRT